MMKRSCLLTFALLLGASYLPTARAQELDEVLGHHYEAMGGLEATKAVQAVRATGAVKVPAQGLEFPIVSYQMRPDRARVEQTVQGATVVQAYDGEQAWMVNPFTGSKDAQPLPAEQAKDLVRGADIDGPLYDAAEKGHRLALAGVEDVDGAPAYKVQVTYEDGDEVFYFLDREHYVPLMRASTQNVQGKEMQVAHVFGDYREVEGLLMPFSVEIRVGGQTASHMTVERYEVNPELDPSLFTMPAPAGGSK